MHIFLCMRAHISVQRREEIVIPASQPFVFDDDELLWLHVETGGRLT